MGELEGKVAIVTGGSSGIGRGTVELFVAEGAKVVIADIDEAAGTAFADELGPDAWFRRTDVGNADDVRALVDEAVARFGTLDIMFNNAGISSNKQSQFLDLDLGDFHRVMDVNVYGVMVGTQAAARQMARQGSGGVILTNASISATTAGLALMTYRTSKAAVLHFSKCVAIDLAQYGIRVNCIIPGHIRTPIAVMHHAKDADTAARVEKALKPVWDANKPLKRQGVPADVAQAALFLASDRAAQITGIAMPVDGGISIGDPVNHLEQILETQARVLAEAG
jgi:NAD(P)-dependent dehydrogenase (short-subunit alcohol dehydrogenase family)